MPPGYLGGSCITEIISSSSASMVSHDSCVAGMTLFVLLVFWRSVPLVNNTNSNAPVAIKQILFVLIGFSVCAFMFPVKTYL